MIDAKVYEKLYKTTRYGKASEDCCPGVRLFPHYAPYLKSPVIDLGCGTGDAVRLLREKGFLASGIDWIDYDPDMAVGDICSVDMGRFETALCIDVFEHLPDEKVFKILEMTKNKIFIVSVHIGQSVMDGHPEDLHINIKPFEEWEKLIGGKLIYEPHNKQRLYVRMPC